MTSATTSWRQRVRDSANRAGLPRFWRWWMSELAPLLPGASRAAFQRRFARPVIELTEGQAIFWRPEISNGAARLSVTESVMLAGDAAAVLAAGRAAVARLAANASAGIAAPKVIVALGPRQVLRKELTLPAAVGENLHQALAYDLDRHTPFRAEQLYFDAAITARDTARKTLRIDWVAALRTIVDGAKKRVEDWGAIPIAVVPGPPTTTPTRLNLLPNGSRPRQLQWRRWQVWAPLAVMALLVGAAVFVPLLQKRQYAIALAGLTAEAGQQAQVADKLRQQLEQMQNDYNYILTKKYAYPSAVHVLDEVTRVLPDDTWLTQLELKTGAGRGKDTQRDVYLRGESANAGKLIALLEDSKLVEMVTPRSPTTKIQGSSGEIFDLGARLRTLPPPQPVTLTANTPPLPAPAPLVPKSAVPAAASDSASVPGAQRAQAPSAAPPAAATGPISGDAAVPPPAAAAAPPPANVSGAQRRARFGTRQEASAPPPPMPQPPETLQAVPPEEGAEPGADAPSEGEPKTDEQ
ncbi:MAG TPA: PilN domain-containing protein [Casimicrobiaceae bacterium]|nr:PilN domain-containing protein [Casimicrobiaceae bacterium]